MNYEINKLHRDEFGRVSGVLAINKPVGLTSHDVVDQIRHKLRTRRVGHAGALDPFASGLLIILVGKATKQSDKFLSTDKEYVATVLFGVATDSGDIEGNITQTQEPNDLKDIQSVLYTFTPEYEQFVPILSSVKVGGDKLRVLARSADRFETVMEDGVKYALFHKGNTVKRVELPKHLCQIPYAEMLEQGSVNTEEYSFLNDHAEEISFSEFSIAKIKIGCSKGTYIRTMAEDIGARLDPPLPAMLLELQRTKVGDITLDQAIEIDNIA